MRSISPAALNQKADLANITYNPEDIMLIRCSRYRSIFIRKSKRRGIFGKGLSVLVRPYRCKIAITGSFRFPRPSSQTREGVEKQ
jgi:hypothetical protein